MYAAISATTVRAAATVAKVTGSVALTPLEVAQLYQADLELIDFGAFAPPLEYCHGISSAHVSQAFVRLLARTHGSPSSASIL